MEAGTLKVTAAGGISSSSALNVRSGALLDLTSVASYTASAGQSIAGSGAISSQSMTVAGLIQTHDTANAIGTLNVTNSGTFTLADGATFALNLGTSAGDRLVASGEVSLGTIGSDTIALTLNLVSQPMDGMVYTILAAGDGLLTNNGLFSYNGTVLEDQAFFDVLSNGYSQRFQINYGSTGDTLTAVDAVPEPGTWAMMLGGLAALAFSQKARRRLKGHA